MAGKKPKMQKSENAGKVRSLHHIDDEDYDDTRERGLKMKEAIAEREAEEKERKAGKSPFGSAELKEDKQSEQENDAQPKETKNNDGEE